MAPSFFVCQNESTQLDAGASLHSFVFKDMSLIICKLLISTNC